MFVKLIDYAVILVHTKFNKGFAISYIVCPALTFHIHTSSTIIIQFFEGGGGGWIMDR